MQSTVTAVSQSPTVRRSLTVLSAPATSKPVPIYVKQKHQYLTIAILLAILAAGLCLLVLTGCQSGTTGTFRPIDASVEHSITNAIGTVMTVNKAVVPFPWSTIFEAAGGASLTLLAAWQAMTHRTATTTAAKVAAIESNNKT